MFDFNVKNTRVLIIFFKWVVFYRAHVQQAPIG